MATLPHDPTQALKSVLAEHRPWQGARLLLRLAPVGDGPWRLTMDRRNGPFGKADSNCLVRGIALPLFW